jgi:glycosyltransferase involved in cell wall biosynthesis
MPMPAADGSDREVSVVIPTKDRAELLVQTLRSVNAQTSPALEIIVADDGSTEDTEGVARAAGARYVRNATGGWGPSGARNAGMAAATGRLVSFIDSDDLMHPRALERLSEALRAAPGAPFAFGAGLIGRRQESGWSFEGVIRPSPTELADFLCSLFVRNTIPSGGGLVVRELALELGGFDTEMVFVEDHAFWLSLARLGEPVQVPEVVCLHRRHGGNRWSPAMSLTYERRIDAMAEVDGRLAGCLARRRGVQLCEVAIDAVHRRNPRELGSAVGRLLAHPHRLQTLAAAAGQLRMRRMGPPDGVASLDDEPALHEWLATY